MTVIPGAPPRPRNRRQDWGIGLIAAASLIWLWLAYQLLFPFTVDTGRGRAEECDSRIFYYQGEWRRGPDEYVDAEGNTCAVARDLAELLAALVLSMPLAVTGTILYTTERRSRDGEGRDEATPISKG
ncbi:hypothetical protein ABT144_37640 [Streptomyces sp. NPDC002039]|uniref:hypothetical protein n=1 Tax=Streptomyces sp. NPDC002039 TaxID=3154660 RepID=UPI00332D632F